MELRTKNNMKESPELPALLHAINTVANNEQLSHREMCIELERQNPSWYISLKVRSKTVLNMRNAEKVIENSKNL